MNSFFSNLFVIIVLLIILFFPTFLMTGLVANKVTTGSFFVEGGFLQTMEGWNEIKDDGEIEIMKAGPFYWVGVSPASPQNHPVVYSTNLTLDPEVRMILEHIRTQ